MMRKSFDSFQRFINNIKRYPSAIRTLDYNTETGIDNMIISGPHRTYFYMRFEYVLSVGFSVAMIIVGILFAFNSEPLETERLFSLFRYWLRIGVVLNLCSILPKFIILNQLFGMKNEEEQILIRRLMTLVRSNIFFWNDKISFIMYIYYVFGMEKLTINSVCGGMSSKLYMICYFILCCFLLRLCNLLVWFFLEYYIFATNVPCDLVVDQGGSQKEISTLPLSVFESKQNLSKNQESQQCGICLEGFKEGEEVRTLPCSKKHIFHKYCTDIWLLRHYICPYCRKSLRLISN